MSRLNSHNAQIVLAGVAHILFADIMTLLGFSSVLGGRHKSVRFPPDIGGRLMFLGRLLHFCKGPQFFFACQICGSGHYTW
jgi:hypothetical protein